MPKTGDVCAVRTKQVLREAVYQLLKTNDFEMITTNRICTTAAISRSTFYTHYEDKYDLMVDAINHQASYPTGPIADENLEAFFEHALTETKQNNKVMERLMKIGNTMELKWKMDDMLQHKFVEYFEHKYPQGNEYGVSAEMLAAYHCHGSNQIALLWIKHGYSIPIDVLASYMAKQLRLA